MTESVDEQIIDEIAPPKRSRHRKKLLYSAIKDQMEFYFSDVNVAKDRFISQLLQNDPYIDLSVFLQFNKIRRLTEKVSDLCKAITKSQILELSEDNLKVRRKTEIRVKENEDECTIYVERLPVDTEHEWLKNMFSKFGPVDYVSIPRYKHNKIIKGFAFIEFATPEIAKNALEYFESIGCKLPTTMLPDKLVSISTFETEKNLNRLDKDETEIKTEKESKTEVPTEPEIKIEDNTKEVRKRKTGDTNEEPFESKKIKSETQSDLEEPEMQESKTGKKKKDKKNKKRNEENQKNKKEDTTEESEQISDKKKEKKKLREEEEILETKEVEKDEQEQGIETEIYEKRVEESIDEREEEDTNTLGEKRKRKRKKNRNITVDLQQYGLQVLSKKEWKQLRNKYLNLQRQKMQGLKEHLQRNRFANTQNVTDKNLIEKEIKTPLRFEFSPGVIVRITLREISVDIKKFKNDLRSQPGLQYIDLTPGNIIGYIRFSDNSSAKKFCELENINADMIIVEGDEEKEYWNKILQNREEKFQKENKKQRGRDKLLRKAEKELGKHIRFEPE